MAEKQKIFFHIGAHKTASSFLQANIRANREKLSQNGLDTVLRRDILETPFGKELYQVSQGEHDVDNVTRKAERNIRSILSGQKQNILVSCEGLVCRLKVEDFYQRMPDSIRYVSNALPDHDIHYIFYVRRQPDFLESVYTQYVHLGRTLSFTRFLKKAAPIDLSWLRVIEGIESTIPRDHITVRPFETIRGLGATGFFQEFLTGCGVANPHLFEVAETQSKVRSANRSYSGVAMKIARRANPLLKGKEQKILRKFLQEHFSTATHPRAELLSKEQRQEIFDRYAGSNQALFERYIPGTQGQALGYY